MSGIGAKLKKEREARGVTLEEVASSTRISHRFLENLEADDYAAFPAEVFVTGFLRSYANHLGLDAEKIIDEYMALKKAEKRAEGAGDEEEEEETEKKKNVLAIAAAVVVAALAVAGYRAVTSGPPDRPGAVVMQEERTSAEKPAPEVDAEQMARTEAADKEAEEAARETASEEAATVAEETPEPAVSPTPTPKPKPEPAKPAEKPAPEPAPTKAAEPKPTKKAEQPQPAREEPAAVEKAAEDDTDLEKNPEGRAISGKYRLAVSAKGADAWILVEVDDQKVWDMFVRDGQTIFIRGDEKFVFTTGNASVVSLSVNGKALEFNAPKNGVLRDWEVPLPE